MSEHILEQIFEKLNRLDERFENMESDISQMETEIKDIKTTMVTKGDISELPFLVRAVREIDDRTKSIEETFVLDIELLKKDVWQLRKKA